MESEEKTGTAIEELGLSVRAYNAVKRFGISTVEELEARIDEFAEHSRNHAEEARELLTKMSQSVIVESADYTKAVTLTRRIKANVQSAQESLFEVCKGLKEMRDGKFYKELGYQNFEQYTENEVGIKKVQAYKYIAIGAMENVHSSEHFEKVGVNKLALLAKLDEPQREEIQQTTDLENTSVKELKKKISELEKDLKTQQDNYSMHTKRREDEIAGYKERQDNLLSRNKELAKELEESSSRIDKLDDEIDNITDQRDEAYETIRSLEKQIDELENRPVEVAVQTKTKTDITAVFNAYAQAATDAMKHLTQFCEKNSNSSEKELFVSKLKIIVSLTEQSINKIGGI